MRIRKSRETVQQELNEAIEMMHTHPRYSKEYASASVKKSRCVKRLKEFDEYDKLLNELASCGEVLTRITKRASLGDLCATYAHCLRKIEAMPEGSRQPQNLEYHKINSSIAKLRRLLATALDSKITSLESRLEDLSKN